MSSNNTFQMNPRAINSGFTIVEMIVVIAIIGILSVIAIPAYQGNVMHSMRSVAVSGLMDMANRQEQFYLNNKTYASDLSNLGYTAGMVFTQDGVSAVALNDNQALVISTSPERVYVIKVASFSATTYSLSAVPQQTQVTDVLCGTMTLDNAYAQTVSGTGMPSDCW